MFELSGVNYEEVLEQGDSILVRVIGGSSYRGFELSGVYCIFDKQHDKMQDTIDKEYRNKVLQFIDIKVINNSTGKYEFGIYRKDAITAGET